MPARQNLTHYTSHTSQGPLGSERKQLTPGHVNRGKPAVQGLLPGVWVEAALGKVDVDIDGTVLLHTLQEEAARAACHLPAAVSTYSYSSHFLRTRHRGQLTGAAPSAGLPLWTKSPSPQLSQLPRNGAFRRGEPGCKGEVNGAGHWGRKGGPESSLSDLQAEL